VVGRTRGAERERGEKEVIITTPCSWRVPRRTGREAQGKVGHRERGVITTGHINIHACAHGEFPREVQTPTEVIITGHHGEFPREQQGERLNDRSSTKREVITTGAICMCERVPRERV
jgi:hypothetical protein